jgi:hypothetical protein
MSVFVSSFLEDVRYDIYEQFCLIVGNPPESPGIRQRPSLKARLPERKTLITNLFEVARDLHLPSR